MLYSRLLFPGSHEICCIPGCLSQALFRVPATEEGISSVDLVPNVEQEIVAPS